IDKHISDGQAFLALLPRSHPLRTACLFGMALTWSRRHELFFGKPEYLEEAIFRFRAYLGALPLEDPQRHIATHYLTSLERKRFMEKDLDELMQLYPIAATDTYASAPNRFHISCQWAKTARAFRHPSASTAYQSAISLMQDSLAFAPTLEIQHFRLVEMRHDHEKLPLDYASYQVRIGHLEQAIETLEQGRGLLWSEMRGFRTSIEQLRAVDLSLAEKFAAVNRDLEALTTSGSSSVWMDGGEFDDNKEMDPFGRLVVKQRKLLDERKSLIVQIQALQGFESFLMAPSFDTLRSAAARGPVIIINHCRWRSDIIILLRDSPPSLIPVTKDFYSRAEELRDRLFCARKQGLGSKEYEEALSSVLKGLYDLVGQPVIERLRELNVQEQSRIWWCPTSAFCSLPLHAMGPVRSDGHVRLYYSDLYIISYTPTLSALIEARKPSAQTSTEPSILLVAQPDATMPNVLREMRVVQAVSPSMATLLWETATPPAALEHLRDHRFAHISCHGILETGKPFNASFKLYEGARLTLLDIVRAQLPIAEFAFLSACHTAELTEESLADEGLHLAGAVQYCGFRSVVGTMWAMADIDGPDLAGSFYRSVFSDKWQGIPYYERTAEALRDSVRILRKKRGMTLERWVNFVHYGA
ncbi:CHAT domain-containing protein, partial [Russula brevipes]